MKVNFIALIFFILSLGSQVSASTQCSLVSNISVSFESNGKLFSAERNFNDSNENLKTSTASYLEYVKSVSASGTAVYWNRSSRILCAEAGTRSGPDFVLQGGSSCRVTYPSESSLMISCADGSSVIYYPEQDAVFLKPDTDKLYTQMAQQTQAMQALVNRSEVLQRKYNAASKALTLSAADFEKITRDIENESHGGPRLPNINDLVATLKSYKISPLDTTLENTYQLQKGRLVTFTSINNSSGLNRTQTEWYFEKYVKGQDRISDLLQKNTASSIDQVNTIIEENINTLISSINGGPFSKEKAAASRAILQNYAPDGIVQHQENDQLNEGIAETKFNTSLTSPDQNTREDAARLRSTFNRLSNHASFDQGEKSDHAFEVMSWVRSADDFLSSDVNDENQETGQRLIERAETYLDFEEGNPPPKFNLSEAEKNLFGANPNTGTFDGYELALVIKEFSRFFGPNKDAFQYYHASISIKQAQKEAISGNLTNFGTFLESAYSVLRVAKGTAQGILLAVRDDITAPVHMLSGIYKLLAFPITSSKSFFNALWGLPDSAKAFWTLIKARARESIHWTPEQQGQFNGQILEAMILGLEAPGFVLKNAKGAEILQKLGQANSWFDTQKMLKGYNKLKEVYPEFDPVNKDYPDLTPASIEAFADASPAFMKELGRKLNANQMTVGMASQLAMFKGGAVRIVLTDDLKYYPSGSILKSARGVSPDIFVFPKDKLASVIEETAGGNAAAMEKILGFDQGSLVGKGLTALEIPMDWKYSPWLPTGRELAANRHFRYGGYTSGGLPELRMTNVYIDDVVKHDLGIFH